MTIAMFVMLISIFSVLNSFLTEGIKQWFLNANKKYSANFVALVNAIVIGCGGTTVAYLLADIPFTLVNIVLILVMAAATWLGSMIGYDKVKQLITQIMNLK